MKFLNNPLFVNPSDNKLFKKCTYLNNNIIVTVDSFFLHLQYGFIIFFCHLIRGGKVGQPAPHLARKNVGRVGPSRKVIAS